MAATLAELVQTSERVRATRARLEKRACLREFFALLAAGDLRLAASYLSGEIPQGRLNVGWRALDEALRAADRGDDMPLFAGSREARSPESLTLERLDRVFDSLQHVQGAGSARRRHGILRNLFEPLVDRERRFLRDLILGELRQGALRAIALEALAETFAVDADVLRRAVMFAGAFAPVVETLSTPARTDAVESTPAAANPEALLARFGPTHGVPIEPMLAASVSEASEALDEFDGQAAVEWKLDGVRVQVHRSADTVHVFSRRLRDVTAQAPETVLLALALDAASFILDGEVIGFNARGRPVAFQDLMSRFSRLEKNASHNPSMSALHDPSPTASQTDEATQAREVRHVETWFFDILELDGRSYVDAPYAERRKVLETLVPKAHRVPQCVVTSAEAAQEIFEAARAAGHEGVVLKQLDAPYTAGRRGSAWRKLKPAETLDLVILAAEWGHGRRRGFLSNLHLGARDPDDDTHFFMLGKTFKGLTDTMLREMTDDLQNIATRRTRGTVFVQPLRVVEIAFDAVQRSRRYDSGFALRFARVKAFRPDKSVQQANTFEDVRRIFEAQHGKAGRQH